MEEITLLELLIKIKRYIKKYFVVFIVFAILGAVFGAYKGQKKEPVYSSMINVSTGLRENLFLYKPDINTLYSELMVVSKSINDADWVRENLNTDSLQIVSMQVDVPTYSLTYQRPNYLTLKIKTYSTEDFERIKRGLEYYFENRSIMKQLYQQDTASINESYEKWYKEDKTRDLISTKGIYDVYKEQHSFRPLFYYVSNYTAVIKEVPSRTKDIILFAVVFLSLAVMITLALELVKFLNDAEQKLNN